jgi:hypothetical protein
MAITLKSCPMCRGAMELKALDKVKGTHDPLVITIHGMPAGVCAKGHASPVHPDFLLWLIQELRERRAAIPAAEEKGLVFKKAFCACGAEIPAGAGKRRGFDYELAFEGAPGFKATLEMPMHKCVKCGKEQLRSAKSVAAAASHAMVEVCDAAKFPHSG